MTKDEEVDYQLGMQAAWQGATEKSMPRYRSETKISLWMRGYNKAKRDMQAEKDRRNYSPQGVQKIADIIKQAIKE